MRNDEFLRKTKSAIIALRKKGNIRKFPGDIYLNVQKLAKIYPKKTILKQLSISSSVLSRMLKKENKVLKIDDSFKEEVDESLNFLDITQAIGPNKNCAERKLIKFTTSDGLTIEIYG